jgi:hypothetical protein
MKKIVLILATAFIAFNMNAQKMWNFSDWSIATYSGSDPVTIDGLTILPVSGDIAIDANNKSIDGYSFTQRLKFGGGGSVTSRNISFSVTGPVTITLYGMSSSGGAERTLIVSDGTNEVGRLTDPQAENTIKKGVVEYSGAAGTIYLYSETSGFNIYGIKVEGQGAPTAIQTAEIQKEIKSIEYFDLLGRKQIDGEIKNSVLIRKITYTDGTTSAGKTARIR